MDKSMEQKQNWLERPIHPALPSITNEVTIFIGIILFAFITRFFDLEARVMSHDESLHTYFSWLLYRGQGYEHSPMMHGPFQFHIIALTYYLFGSSDLTARIPAVLFSIGTVWMVWYWRRYLGKWGALIAGFMLVISPFMLFYGRYVRNESFVGFSGIVMLYAMLRHLEVGGKKYLLMLSAALVLHFTSKETSFIYTAQALLFLAIYFIAQVTRYPWTNAISEYRAFLISLGIAFLLAAGALGYGMYASDKATVTGNETAAPSNPGDVPAPLPAPETDSVSPALIIAVIAILVLAVAAYFLIKGYTWERLRNERSFDLLMVCGTIVLPMLSPFPIKWTERWLNVAIPTTAAEVQALSENPRSILVIAGFLIVMFILAIAAGLIWNKEKFWQTALVFWIPFTILYTTVFTNSDGFFTGTIGSLGYWIVQQDVERGSQPWYYYILVQIPIYEFLPAIGFLFAMFVGLRRKLPHPSTAQENAADDGEILSLIESESNTEEKNFPNMFSLLVWWSFTSVIAFSIAGERMPWLTYHMAWPMILLTGWGLGQVIETTDWARLKDKRVLLTTAAVAVFIVSAVISFLSFTGVNPPFQGKELAQLQATSAFLLPAIVTIISGIGIFYLLNGWTFRDFRHVFTLVVFAFLALLTARASFRASYITYDQATEFLVYAHGASGIKEVMAQAKEISLRTTGGMGVAIAYDASAPDTGVSWPFVWYLRDYTNQRSFDQPTRSLRESVVVVVDEKNFDKIETALGPGYYRMDYIRMWWPMQDYFTLSFERNPQFIFSSDAAFSSDLDARKIPDSIRAEIGKIEKPLGTFARVEVNKAGSEWMISQLGRHYLIRNENDVLNIYSYKFPDDYACKGLLGFMRLSWARDYTLFCEGFTNPQIRDGIFKIWMDRDYTQYAAAKGRQDLSLTTWNPADKMRLYIRQDVASQIWNYGVAPAAAEVQQDPTEDKYVLLSADNVISSLANEPLPMNAPRSLDVAKDGTLYLADSRNHRILHLDTDGTVIDQWGIFADGVSQPVGDGTMNEPWGVAVGPDGSVYVTDTWNHRIEKFTADGEFITAWGVFGQGETPSSFYGPRGLAVDSKGRVYVTDTGNKRIVVFDKDGNFITEFGSGGFEAGQFDEPVGVAVDKNGTVYVVDTWNQRVQTFTPIETETSLSFVPTNQWDVFGWFGQSLDNKPFIAVNDELHVFITDPDGYRVMEFDPNGVLLKTWGDFGDNASSFGLPSGITIDNDGGIWVSDSVNNRLMRFTLPD